MNYKSLLLILLNLFILHFQLTTEKNSSKVKLFFGGENDVKYVIFYQKAQKMRANAKNVACNVKQSSLTIQECLFSRSSRDV